MGSIGRAAGEPDAFTAAINALRNDLNKGRCQAIYDGAASGFQLQAFGEWKWQCDRLREGLGEWKSFDHLSTTGRNWLTYVEGDARFAKGARRVTAVWALEDGRARLFRLEINGKDRSYFISVPRRNRPALMDPPMRPPPGPPPAGRR